MDGTRAAELKVSLNDTISRVLDDKLPKIISRACTDLDIFKRKTAPWLLFVAYTTFHLGFVTIMQIKILISWSTAEQAGIASGGSEADSHLPLVGVAFRNRIARGLTISWVIAVVISGVLQFPLVTIFHLFIFDEFDLLALTDLSFSLLLVVGALISVLWPSEDGAVHLSQRYRDEEELGEL
ncbi:MAG: hypothetical protein Q9221_000633 [Calogaya cf. arnoldii]